MQVVFPRFLYHLVSRWIQRVEILCETEGRGRCREERIVLFPSLPSITSQAVAVSISISLLSFHVTLLPHFYQMVHPLCSISTIHSTLAPRVVPMTFFLRIWATWQFRLFHQPLLHNHILIPTLLSESPRVSGSNGMQTSVLATTPIIEEYDNT